MIAAFLMLGSLLAPHSRFGQSTSGINAAALQIVTELTLVIVLFHDASTVKLTQLRHDPGVAGAWLLAAAVTATDAGLGAAGGDGGEVQVDRSRMA